MVYLISNSQNHKNPNNPNNKKKLTKIEKSTMNNRTRTSKANPTTMVNTTVATTEAQLLKPKKTTPILIQFQNNTNTNTNTNKFTKFTLEENSEHKPTLEIIIPKPSKSLSSETFKYTNERGKGYQMRPYIHNYKEPFYDID